MKSKIVIFPIILLFCGIGYTNASECIGDGCGFNKPTELSAKKQPKNKKIESTHAEFDDSIIIQEDNIETRKPLWDGDFGQYKPRAFDKTVDWRDGVPLWDDSISNYKDKDFTDFYAGIPTPVSRFSQINGRDFDTLNQIEELLSPKKPSDNIWSDEKTTFKLPEFFEIGDGCPFETDAECDIWRKKPMVNENVSPRSPKLRAEKMDAFIAIAKNGCEVDQKNPAAAPLIERYKMLMKSSNTCCTDGMAYELKRAGATKDLIYKFLADDANFYGLGSRCLMMSDKDFDRDWKNTSTSNVAADVRNGCLCRGKQWFTSMLAPFEEAYETAPEFAKTKFNYTYTDGLQREITVSINGDVQNVLNQLSVCP